MPPQWLPQRLAEAIQGYLLAWIKETRREALLGPGLLAHDAHSSVNARDYLTGHRLHAPWRPRWDVNQHTKAALPCLIRCSFLNSFAMYYGLTL